MSDKYPVFARFKNGFKQVRTGEKDRFGNDFRLLNLQDELVILDFLNGIVPLSGNRFQLYQKTSEGTRLGLLDEALLLDWDSDSPREVFDQAYAKTKALIDQGLNELEAVCFCSYPRIVNIVCSDFFQEQSILRSLVQHRYLKQSGHSYDESSDEYRFIYTCKHCKSTYLNRYKERGIDSFKPLEKASIDFLGLPVESMRPTYLQALFERTFYDNMYLKRARLYEASLEEMLTYLFAERL